MYVYMCMSVYTCHLLVIYGYLWRPYENVRSLELELKSAISRSTWVLGTQLGSFLRAVYIFKPLAISKALRNIFIIKPAIKVYSEKFSKLLEICLLVNGEAEHPFYRCFSTHRHTFTNKQCKCIVQGRCVFCLFVLVFSLGIVSLLCLHPDSPLE